MSSRTWTATTSVFMDMETYDQLHVDRKAVGDAANFPWWRGFTATVAQHEGEVLFDRAARRRRAHHPGDRAGVQGDTPPAAPSPPSWRPVGHQINVPRSSSPPVRRSRSTPAPATTAGPGEQLTVAARNTALCAFQILFAGDQLARRRRLTVLAYLDRHARSDTRQPPVSEYTM